MVVGGTGVAVGVGMCVGVAAAALGPGAAGAETAGTTLTSDGGASWPDQGSDIKSPVAMRKRNRTPRMTPTPITAP